MLAWMVYVVVVTLLLGAAAFAAERSAQMRKAPTRWLWGASIIASLVLPTVMSSVSIQIPQLSSTAGQGAPAQPMPLRQLTAAAVRPSAWLDAGIGPMAATPSVDTVLTCAWAAASALIFAGILANGALLYRRKRGWTREKVAGTQVYVSEDVGPAVVGLLRPGIVLPRWIAQAPRQTQALVLAHEQSHLDAGDAQLLAIAILLIVTMPWNLPLWWQLRRLRFAIEVDCDARVLKGGHDVSRYGETLIMVGERQSSRLAVVVAMSESRSFLEQRIRKMLPRQTRFAWAAGAAMAGLGFVLAASAAEVSPPNAAPLKAGWLQAVSGSPAAAGARASGPDLKRYRSGEWSFALDVPKRWNEFPPNLANSPYEVLRFQSREHGKHSLIVFRDSYDPAAGPDALVAGTQETLARGGFSHFLTGEAKVGARTVRTLDFDRPMDGGTWSCRYFFFPEGTLVYILAFGTTDRKAMFPLYDRLAQTFTVEAPAAAAADAAVPAVHRLASVAFRLVDDPKKAGDERVSGPDGKDLWLAPGAVLTGAMFASVQAGSDAGGEPVVNFTLTPEGGRRLAAATRQNVGRRVALVVNGKAAWAPVIHAEIAGGAGQIRGRFTRAQADALARDIALGIPAS